jgi:glutathione synthase/RimK-type ligase-like ATP-grasp enzyme
LLYEDKKLEAYIAAAHHIPFAKTYVSHDRDDALALVEAIPLPVISKLVPSSGSIGMELVRTRDQARRVIRQAFSRNGHKSHRNYFRQKNCVYFQEFVPNDGYDIRVIVVGNWVFGYYRKVLPGDFRASGMDLKEKRALPPEAMKTALRLNQAVRSPMLVVDMVHGLDGQYYVIEFSPISRMPDPDPLHVEGIPGVYIFRDEDTYRFEKGKWWVQELALREFLLNHYLPARSKTVLLPAQSQA